MKSFVWLYRMITHASESDDAEHSNMTELLFSQDVRSARDGVSILHLR